MEILSSRTILRPRDYDTTLLFYGETLGSPLLGSIRAAPCSSQVKD